MFEGAVAGILNRLLGKYVQDLDTENLNVGIFSGHVHLNDLKLKPEALYELDLPIDVKIGTIGRISLQIPWSGLYSQPVTVHIEDVLILVGPAISNSYFDPEREKRLTRAAKRKILQDLEAESEILKGPQNFFESFFTAIVNNIQVYVRNVHIRYEDSISSKDGPLAGGLCLQSLSIETTNSKWKPSVTPSNASTVYQMMRIESLSLYWNPTATVLEDTETANITPIQYYNWKHYMLTGLDKFSMHHEDFEFLLKPVTCKVKVLINRSGEARVPRLLLDAVLQDSALQLSRQQYLSLANIATSFDRIKLNRKYRHLHPGIPLCKGVRKWWLYAYNVVLEQRVRPYTWAAIKRHRENHNSYKQAYKSTLKSPNDTELKLDLQQCEDSLPIVSVVIAREQAKFELLSQESDRVELVETEADWWKLSDEIDGADEEARTRVELCVKTGRCRSVWSHLSSPERKRVCELIGYAEGAPRDRSKQYIEHKINLTLANCSATLLNRSKEILVATLTHFLASLETRPSAKAYKLSARAESLLVEGSSSSSDGELVPLLAGSPSAPGGHLVALDFERRPLNSHADYGLSCLVEPLTVTYVEHAFSELINFFQTRWMSRAALASELHRAAVKAKGVSKALAVYAISRRKVFQLHVDVKGPCVVVPECGVVTNTGRVLVLDISRVTVKSDLQPPNLTLEDATCMELEERLYDRLHAECCCQILFCAWSEPWRESRKHVDSDLHLVPRMRALVVFSNSIKKDYKLLPRYKLNVSVSSFKLNVSERVIGQLLCFVGSLPVPAPTTAIDCADAADPVVAAVLGKDRVDADPEYGDLINLRQKIVAAYLAKNRTAEARFDKAAAKLGFQTNDQVFLSSEHSDEDMEVYARSVDLPGFDDNVSPSNTINTLLRFVVGEIVINLSRSVDHKERPYVMLSITKVCLDVALMQYGPAIQLAVTSMLLTDKQHHSSSGQYLEMITSEGELFNLLYRKVRANCPEFKSHFHAVEQSLVADAGPVALVVHATALRQMCRHLLYVGHKIQSWRPLAVGAAVVPRARVLWERLMRPEADPPVPPGATKFSYSVRTSSILVKLVSQECALLEMRLGRLESDCVFRANDRVTFQGCLGSLHVDDPAQPTLYPKLVWPDEDKVLEVKYVRAAPRVYCAGAGGGAGGGGEGGAGAGATKAHGQLRVAVGRLHGVLLASHLQQLQQFVEPLVPGSVAAQAAGAAERAAARQLEGLRTWKTRLSLVIQIHAPVLLLPQKPSSPNLLVLNMGDLQIENFFKQLNSTQEATSPIQSPIIDNILIRLDNVTFSRAVMTLAGTLEVQEPILEPVSLRCDMKRAVCYAQASTAHRDLVLCEADVTVDPVSLTLGQQDLATVLAVWTDNLSEACYLGSMFPSSPVEGAPSDAALTNLQAFFAQGEPVRKEVVLRFTLEGVELKLFSDTDEVLSSPVRDLNHGLAKMTAGEVSLHLDYYSDDSAEMRASLLSLLVEDIRPDPNIVIKRIFQSQGGATRSTPGISVRRPPLIDVSARATTAGRSCDVRIDKTRLNLSLPFLLQLARTLLDAMPGERVLEGGVVNHGYVGDGHGHGHAGRPPGNNNRPPSCADSTSGYCSAAIPAEEAPALSVSVHFRQPELMLFTGRAHEGHALLVRAELMLDYSSHARSFVLSLAGLQVLSKLQSKLKNLPPQLVLKPCDIEFSKTCKSVEDGVRAKLTLSEIEVHVAATTVHTVLDLIEEVDLELNIAEEEKCPKSPKSPNPSYQKPEKTDEDLWSPKKLAPCAILNPEDSYSTPKYPALKALETFSMSVPNIKVLFELEQAVRVPVLVAKLTCDVTLHDWSRDMHGDARATVTVSCYNERARAWEPLVEPTPVTDAKYRPWGITATLFQEKAYAISSRLNTAQDVNEPEPPADTKTRKRNELESETSADECDTDCEMTFIRNPNGAESKGVDLSGHMSFLTADGDDSDSERGDGLMDKLAAAIAHLFTDDSSAGELSNDEDSSAPEQSDAEQSETEDQEKAVTFDETDAKCKRDGEHKNVTLQEPTHEDSVDSGLESESVTERQCTYILLESRDTLNVTVTPSTARVLLSLAHACTDRAAVVSAIVTGDTPLVLVNDIGPGSTVHLKTKAETDLAGNDRILAVADYDVDHSRPSTPGCDTSADLLEDALSETKPEMMDVSDEWDCFEGGFPTDAVAGPAYDTPTPAGGGAGEGEVNALYRRHTDETLTVRLHDMDQLTVLCPQRTMSKLHVLHPSKNNTRYYVVVERVNGYNTTKVVVRSPLQIRNETSYALELLYKKSELLAVGAEPIGALTNPFDDRLRLAVLAPHDTYNVPLYIAYHCRLYLQPANFESYQSASQGIWWAELAAAVGRPRELVCRARADEDPRVFALTLLTTSGVQSHKVTRAIPNFLIRVLPPLAIYNRLPYALEVATVPDGDAKCGEWRVRVEAGERAQTHSLELGAPRRLQLHVRYLGLPWTGSFTLSPDTTEKVVSMWTERETDGGNKQLAAVVRVVRDEGVRLLVHAPYWLINRTTLPLQLKARHSDTCYEVTEEPLLWAPVGRARRDHKIRLRAHQSAWSRAARPAACAPGLVVCAHTERKINYRLLLTTTLSELCPQLTKIVTLLPYFIVYNDTKRHLRFMEENEAADLWMDLSPLQCTPFWPQTDSMQMHVKFRDSPLVSQHFPITTNHFTVLRMDKGCAICVEVSGGTDRPFTITFRPYSAGAAPVRVDNLCDDLFLKLHQQGNGQVALLSPHQSLLYTWDDPTKERTLLWNTYNNKGNGHAAHFAHDGYGEEKVSVHSVKHPTLAAANSVTSKLSSTLKRLTPRSPEAYSSSSGDSDGSAQPDSHGKAKKTRKDKAIVYWVSYLDGYQRVLALMQDEKLFYQYRMMINSERSHFEIYTSLAEVTFSVCVDTASGVTELALASLTDSLPRWEVNVSHKWKQLSPDLAAWVEDRYQAEQKKCNLKEYIHIDLEKMQMTKPFFSELRRTYNPGLWLQLRKSETLTYCHLKVNRLQIDNQLPEAVFPTVLHPTSLPVSASNRDLKPCVEVIVLKQHRPHLNQDVYKYLKVLLQEYSVNLDRGFVNYVFDILNHWKIEEKPAVRLRADLALVHMPLHSLAKRQMATRNNVVMEYVHLSPIKVVLSLSSRGYSAETATSPSSFGNQKENRPKLFNSDLLEYLFNSWGSSLCDMKDVVIRMAYLELRNAPISAHGLLEAASQHYWTQLVQQFYVLVLGLNILGNPYSVIGDFAKGLKHYYDPRNGSVSRAPADIAYRLGAACARLFGHCARAGSATATLLAPPAGVGGGKRAGEDAVTTNDIPETVIEGDRNNAAHVALALTGLLAGPSLDEDYVVIRNICREAAAGALLRQRGGAETALRALVERSGGRLVAKRRLPRHCANAEGVGVYCAHAARGAHLLRQLARAPCAPSPSPSPSARATYVAHAPLDAHCTLLVTTQHVLCARGSASGAWRVEWSVPLDDLVAVPHLDGDALVLTIKQDELTDYFATDEKAVAVADAPTRHWLRARIEAALILALEDKRVPEH